MKVPLLLPFLLVSAVAAAQVQSIPGWKQKELNGHYIFTPNTLLQTNFSYELMPLITGGDGELGDWLQQAATKNIQSSGYNQPAAKDQQSGTIQSFKMYTAIVSDKAGKRWTLNYVAYRKPDGEIRFARITSPAGPKSQYLNTALNHFVKLSKSEGIVLKADNTAKSGNSKTTEKVVRKKVVTPTTAPGQGIKPAEIKGVVINQEYGVGVGGMMIVEYRPYLMLTNGTVYKWPDVAPYDLDVAASKTAEPNKWGTWKLQGKTLVVQLPEKGVMKEERWDHWFWTKMPNANETIKGAYMTIGGGGNTALGGSTMVYYSSNINFNSKGQFTMKKSGGGSNSDFDVSTSAYSNSNFAGTYKLNGYSIEMRFNNGQVKRNLFYFYPDSRTTFGIGDDAYVTDK
jgi:hypothetical protein